MYGFGLSFGGLADLNITILIIKVVVCSRDKNDKRPLFCIQTYFISTGCTKRA